MDNFTYERENRTSGLEMYEWDNLWWEQAPNVIKPRVLYIGDSISCGIRRIATNLSGEQILFDGFGTSKAVDNAYFADTLRLFGKQQRTRKIVLFNNGLHGFHLSDGEEYRDYYEKMVKFLMEEYRDIPIALVLTTSVADSDNERVIARNESVKAIAEKYNLPVIDLYSVSVQYEKLHSADGVHYTEEGYEKLAQNLVESVYEIIGNTV